MSESKLNTEFYEDVGDLLADFRKKYNGGLIGKNGKDPFDSDPDMIQSSRETNLREQEHRSRQY